MTLASALTVSSPASTTEQQRLAAIFETCSQARRGQVVIIHGSGEHWADELLDNFRRFLLGAREPAFEARCQSANATTYGVLRDLLLTHLRHVHALGKLDAPLHDLVLKLDPFLSLSNDLPLPPAPPPVDPSHRRASLHQSLSDLAIALSRSARAVWILRSLHLSDAATLSAIQSLLDACTHDPILHTSPQFQGFLLVTAHDSLATSLRAAFSSRDNIHFLSLNGLDEQAVRLFLQRPDVIQRVLSSTGGQPDHLQTLLHDLPPDTDHILRRRRDRLPNTAQRVLDLLAVRARPMPPEVVARLLHISPPDFAPALRSLSDERLIEQRASRGELLLQLAPHLDPSSLQNLIPPAQLQHLHGVVGEWLENQRQFGQPVEAESLAHHFLRSPHSPRALQYAIEAAEHLHISHAYPRAIEWLQASLPLIQDPTQRRDVLDRLIDLHRLVDHGPRALFYCGQRKRITPPAERAELNLLISQILIDIGRFQLALRIADRAVLSPDSSPLTCLSRLSLMAEALHNLGQWQASSDLCQQALALPTPSPAALRVHVQVMNTEGKNLLSRERYADAQETFARALSLCQHTAWDEERCRTLMNCGVASLKQRRFSDAEATFELALREGQRASHPHAQAFALLNLAVLHHRTLHWSRALDCYLPALNLLRRNGSLLRFSNAALNLADLYLDLGDADRALNLVRSVEPHVAQGQPYYRVWVPWLLARVAIEQEQHAQALRHLSDACAAIQLLATQHSPWTPSRGVYITRARLNLMRGDLPAFFQDIDRKPPLDTPTDDYWEAHATWLHGCAAAARNLLPDAHALLSSAAASFTALGKPNWVWEVQCDLAALAAAQHKPDACAALLDQARGHLATLCARVPQPLQSRFTARRPALRLFSALDAIARGLPPFPSSSPPSSSARRPNSSAQLPRLDLLDPAELRAWRLRYDDIIGEHPKLLETFRRIDRCAPSESPVLILGESGCGKERLADAIHRHSTRASAPLIKVNCGAFVESLLMSELFGHEKGAFTGALNSKPGRFELAHGGTLFLDEVGDISPKTQVALLRVLQEGTFERVGGSRTLHANVRLVCATNRNLEQLVKAGTFRLDLYYRLKGIVLELPPLRDRIADIPRLVTHFLNTHDPENPRQFSREALLHLLRYPWPGNIRELQNFVRAISILVPDPIIQRDHLSLLDAFFSNTPLSPPSPDLEHILDQSFGSPLQADPDPEPLPEPLPDPPSLAALSTLPNPPQILPPAPLSSPQTLQSPADLETQIIQHVIDQKLGLSDLKKRLELECIRHALLRTQGNITQAASILQMKRPRLSQIINACADLRKLKDNSSDTDE